MKARNTGGPFGCPSGQVLAEGPDGVTRTFGEGTVHNSLTNSAWASGGSNGGAFGAWPEEGSDSNVTALRFGPDKARFRID